ncbi:TIGR01244 family sulfur transferase [Frigidibacter oleivorans]|uniref:TIGR01244 family sulfur transferase n=1 Tax=Frigidibacter oleivorans TaxID=2487129 RepID=UPI000F8DFEE5|nr:TIGR01244 family sulfur transferase [Frigidibacter oleivorans]
MDIRPVVPGFAAAPQLQPEDMAAVAAQGFRTVICNRPDDEQPGQPDRASMEAAARAAGMEYRFLPIAQGFPPAMIEGMRAALDDCPGPVLAYCRSGTRSTFLWALAEAGHRPAEEIVAAAAGAGYDLAPIRGALGG